MRATNPSGIVTTTSGGKAVKVVVSWADNTADGRTLDIYGKNSAYSGSADLYSNSTQGELIGSIVNGTSIELDIDGDYEYIGMRSRANAMYIESITIKCSSGSTYDNLAIRFSGVISTSDWNALNSESPIQGFGMMFSSSVSELVDTYNDALDTAGSMAGAITSIKNNASIKYFDNSVISDQVHDGAQQVALPDVSGTNYVWSLYKTVSMQNFKKPYYAVAFIKLQNELVFLGETSVSAQDLANALKTRMTHDDGQSRMAAINLF